MRLTCVILLAVISVISVTESVPISDGVGTAPCVDYEQKHMRRKRSPFLPLFFPVYYQTQPSPNVFSQTTNVNNVSVNGPGTVSIVTNNSG